MSLKYKLELGVVLIAVVILSGISAIGILFYEASSDKTSWRPFVLDPPEYPEQPIALETGFYLDRVQPILNRRCIACHGCLDSPCNLKMTSFEGVIRGAKGVNVDDPHLFAEEPVRLYDAPSVEAWRQRDFCNVIDQTAPPMERPSRSILYRMVSAGAERNQPLFPLGPLQPVYAKADAHLCPCGEEINTYLKKRPSAGMPFGLPGISQEQLGTFSRWIPN